MRRPLAAVLSSIAAVFLASLPGAVPTASAAITPAATSTAMFGGDLPVAQYEAGQGHPVAIVRSYDLIGQKFAGGRAWAQVMGQGSTLLASIDLAPGQTYAQVTAGAYDSQITSWLHGAQDAAVQYGLPSMWVSFEHEANGVAHHPASMGSPAGFRAAWAHIHGLADSAGLNAAQGGRLHWVMILTRRGYEPASRYCPSCGLADAFYPGAGQADAAGVDGYNRAGCSGGRTGYAAGSTFDTPAALFGPALDFARAHALPLMVAEVGSDAYRDPGVQAGFINAMRDWVTANPGVTAAMYWNGPDSTTTCKYSVFDYPQSLAALASMQQALTGHATAQLTADYTLDPRPQRQLAATAAAAAHAAAQMYLVRRGDTLTSISVHAYGRAGAWPVLYWANHRTVRWADIIGTGWRIVIPPLPARIPAAPSVLAPAAPRAPPAVHAAVTSADPADSAPAAAPAPAAPVVSGGVYSYGALEALWISAGGPSWAAPQAARIGICESGGNPMAYNPSGASGLFQILGQVVPGNIFNPFVNALNAVSKFRASGDTFAQWVCQ